MRQRKNFHGVGRRYPYFEGWYLKHQKIGKTVAVIPALHAERAGAWSASIQVITPEHSWNFKFPIESCHVEKERFYVKIGDNVFTEKGMILNLEKKEIVIRGHIAYHDWTPQKRPLMGIFGLIPGMECNHNVLSMSHGLKGVLQINDEKIDWNGGWGYVETDWGSSFPEHYLWTQCQFGKGGISSVMGAVAKVPLFGTVFTGALCQIQYGGKVYRIGTPYGGRVKILGDGTVVLKQGNQTLSMVRLDEHPQILRAPVAGGMRRRIKESVSCRVQYRFWIGKRQIFNIISSQASFEQA